MVRAQSQRVFVNELLYDSFRLVNGTNQEVVPNLIEIAGPAGTNLSSYSLVLYNRVPNPNGNIDQGQVYGSLPVSGIIPDQENGFGVLSFTYSPGTLDRNQAGIAVVDGNGVTTNFISYETSLTAINGPANGLVSKQTTVQNGSNGNQSLQLQGTGSIYTDFTWSGLFTQTPGQINKAFNNVADKQVFVQPTYVNLSLSRNTATEGETPNTITVSVTASRPVVGNQTVSIAGAGTNIDSNDFGLTLLTITIPSGSTVGTTTVVIKDDDLIEGTETLTLTISRPSTGIFLGITTTQDITIFDNDALPALTVSPATLSFSTSQGVASAQQSYVLSATALATVLEARAPAGVEISQTSGSGFTNVVTLPRSTTSATIYARIAANAPVGAINGTIVNFSGSQTANVAVTGTVSATTAANQAPVAVATPNQSATVGTNVSFVANAFTDPNGDALTYTVSGLPAGLNFAPATRTISGVPSVSGVSTVTITGTDPGSLSASTSFQITISAAPVNPPTNLAPVAITNPNQTATVGVNFQYTVNAFTDPNGDVLTYSASGLPAGLTFAPATRSISGVPSTSGVSTVTITGTDPGSLSASTSFQITINATPVVNPPVGGSLQFLPPTYNCATGAFTFNTQGGNGSPITFSAIGIVGPTTTSGSSLPDDVDAGLAAEIRRQSAGIEPIELIAVQSGVRIVYLWDARNACLGNNPNPNPTPNPPVQGNCGSPTNTLGQPLTLLQPTYDCASGIIRFNTTGGNGSAITYSAVGITPPTTDCVATLDRGNTDNNTYQIIATQNGVMSTISWTRPCASLRVASQESGTALTVSVLGNPVTGDVVQFEVRGAEGEPLRAVLIDGMGHIVSETAIQQANAVEQQSLRLGKSAGLYFLRVNTARQSSTVKVVKP